MVRNRSISANYWRKQHTIEMQNSWEMLNFSIEKSCLRLGSHTQNFQNLWNYFIIILHFLFRIQNQMHVPSDANFICSLSFIRHALNQDVCLPVYVFSFSAYRQCSCLSHFLFHFLSRSVHTVLHAYTRCMYC